MGKLEDTEDDIIAVSRARRYSPGAEERDMAILKAVAQRLKRNVNFVDEDAIDTASNARLYISMARSERALDVLQRLSEQGAAVINTPQAVAACSRRSVSAVMRQNDLPMPPEYTDGACWIKRGDRSGMAPEDIAFCPTRSDAAKKLENFRRRGITDIVVTSHVEGECVKFYGVAGGFFRCYPQDADECPQDVCERIKSLAFRLAGLVGIDVFGGDCVLTADGQLCIIDFNDWPSFSPCRDEAAAAIADHIRTSMLTA